MKYSAKPEHVSPHYNRHWYRHILVAFSPGGILPLPFQVWLWFPDEILITCYHIGMVPDMLLSSCSPDWGHAERFATDLARFEAQWGHRLVDRKSFSRVKASLFGLLRVVVQGESWQSPLRVFSRNASGRAFCFRPGRKDQLEKFQKYGLMFWCYDLARQKVSPKGVPRRESGQVDFRRRVISYLV